MLLSVKLTDFQLNRKNNVMSKTIVFQGDSITDCGRSRMSVASNTGLGSGYVYMTADEGVSDKTKMFFCLQKNAE